ncbi:hypothetical protein [Flavobacterium sp. LAR06]|uniref:hypothetical protein n=1 Tax=Flavobacterium sp. LAR06 TaxID=3064897 RepID=UPI0035C18E23
MSVKSKFNFLAIFLISFITVLPLLVVYLAAISSETSMILPFMLLGFIVFFWLTVFRTRAHKVEIDGNTIIVKHYFGVGKSESYDFSTLDGFIILFESAKGSVYESLFILKNGKRVGSISSFYHSNFDQLKSILKDKLIDLGVKESTFTEESSELFK